MVRLLFTDPEAGGAADPLVGQQVGGFDVLAPLGRGAFATVYRAHQIGLHRDVALKVLDPMLARDPLAARRFTSEGRHAAELDHPSIVPVYEAGEDGGWYFLAMRLIGGWSLADELRTSRRLQPDRLRAIVTPLASALDHAHLRGIVHRDVKPENILLEPDRVWLTDFGIAATAQSAGQYTTGSIGTAQYMAPEQAQPGPIDGRADLYALGCVIYECITGRPPYEGDDLAPLLYSHARAPIPGSGNLALDTFMLRALAKLPAARFANGAELDSALGGALAGQPVVASAAAAPHEPAVAPPAPLPPARRAWWRRR